MKLKIAFLQISPGKCIEENLKIGIEACKSAAKLGADIALFPEMWSNGYDIYDRLPEVHGNAYRRPQKYDILLNEEVSAPFIREDRRK